MVQNAASNNKPFVVSSFSSNIELLEGGKLLSETNKKAIFRAEFIRLVVLAGFESQQDLALKIGVNPSTIRATSSGTRAPDASLLTDLYALMGEELGRELMRLMKSSPAVEQLRKRRKKVDVEGEVEE